MSSRDAETTFDFLTGELSTGDRERFADRIAEDRKLSALVEEMAPLVRTAESVPGEVWDPPETPSFESVRGAFAGPVLPEGKQSERTRRRRGLGALRSPGWARPVGLGLASLLLVAAGVGIGINLGGDSGPGISGSSERLALEALSPDAPSTASGEVLVASNSVNGDRVELDVSGLEETGKGQFYEFWLLGEKGELVALGSFRVDREGHSRIEVPVPVDPARYTYFDVSIEPRDGRPEHSGRSVLRGPTTIAS